MTKKELLEEESWDGDDEDTMKDRYLTFHLGEEDYGIEIAFVKEIVGMQKITEVPDMPGFVKGVINLRGLVIPLIDIRMRFQMNTRTYDERTCIIVVEINSMQIGLVVDMVNEVIEIPENQISPTPQVAYSPKHNYIKGMGKVGEDVKIILDIQKLLFEEEIKQLVGTI